MTLRKLTLSIGLLAASLMLAAPAQAETWACTSKTVKPGSPPVIYYREGNSFRMPFRNSDGERKYEILMENDEAIHLYAPPKKRECSSKWFSCESENRINARPINVLALFKRKPSFVEFYTNGAELRHKMESGAVIHEGHCTIY